MPTALSVKPDYSRVKREVLAILEKFGLKEPPIDPVDLAHQHGLSVFFVEFENSYENVSGFYDVEEKAIFVNRDEIPDRQTFTIAHELGHHLLHQEYARSNEYKLMLRNSDEFSGEDPREKEANAFAAHLLVPRVMLDRYWRRLTVRELSRLFAVSVPVIKNRLNFEYGAQ